MSVSIKPHTIAAFAAGLVAAMIAAFTFQAVRADAVAGDEASFVPITPCRLIDTRPGPDRINVIGAFGNDNTRTVQAVGTNGSCTIPADAVGLSLNVTAVGATAPTFLTIWPDGTRPKASSLNPAPGQPPTPNAVTTNLSANGAFKAYNKAGTVNVIIDINGYYTKTTLQELDQRLSMLETAGIPDSVLTRLDALEVENTAQQAEIDALEAENTAQQAEIDALEAENAALEGAQPFVVTAFVSDPGSITTTPAEVVSVEVTAPVDGHVTVNSTAKLFHSSSTDGSDVVCAVVDAATLGFTNIGHSRESVQWMEIGGSIDEASVSGTRTFSIAAGATVTYVLACEELLSDGGYVDSANLTAIFTPAP